MSGQKCGTCGEPLRATGEWVPACVEHVWVVTGMVTAADGTHVERECRRCGASALQGPADLRGES